MNARTPVGGTPRLGARPHSRGPRGGASAIAATPGFSTSTSAPIRGRSGRGTTVAGLAPNRPARSTVSPTSTQVTVDVPVGGDRSTHTRSAAAPVAPAPIRYAVKVLVLAGGFFVVHAAATHPAAAVALAITFLAITVLTARRPHHA